MGITVLSKELVNPQDTFKNIALASLNAGVYFAISEGALKQNGAIQSINIGFDESHYEILLTDILSEKHSIGCMEDEVYKFLDRIYYPLLATNYAPSKLSYDFSLAYLRLCPEHLISIYEHVFNLNDIEAIENSGLYNDTWYYGFRKIDGY